MVFWGWRDCSEGMLHGQLTARKSSQYHSSSIACLLGRSVQRFGWFCSCRKLPSRSTNFRLGLCTACSTQNGQRGMNRSHLCSDCDLVVHEWSTRAGSAETPTKRRANLLGRCVPLVHGHFQFGPKVQHLWVMERVCMAS